MSAVRYEQTGGVVTITIDRPAQMNAINAEVRTGLFEAFTRFEGDASARVAILTGAGDKAFCAGMDLKEAAANSLAVPPKGFLPLIGQGLDVTKPTIAAVNGVAFAGGWMFAQMCDLCLAAEHATFGITEARVGRGMPWAAPLVTMVQQRALMELLLTAEPISAQRAREIGFVNHVVPAAELLPRCVAIAEKIAANAPLTVRAARELVYLSTEMGRSAAQRAATHLFESVYLSEDAQEGPRAFREKRKPEWKGR
ncbi:MAG TPA: enoyl-CoA hydratase-related protein [Caldimonas sp.]|jgi:enoyl-CoA hydratase/carnithine racemase|nr:enoyl-CoA hydratase-related protein [Caldimonas sp.]HEX2540166.1 enoyl-CoA hydratase-related protein [Caldimonas sp.]